ncbi:MAG: hypothetical protein Q8O43_04355 [Dehalococcoidia bacterium]|nr:hypothetical protein [Dehalococcoidia bacterium]
MWQFPTDSVCQPDDDEEDETEDLWLQNQLRDVIAEGCQFFNLLFQR